MLESSKKILGADHPSTLTRIADLARTYGDQGRWEEAEELQLQVLEISENTLETEHPSSLIGMDDGYRAQYEPVTGDGW